MGKPSPTTKEIMQYRNVPVFLAAAYMGVSCEYIRYGIEDKVLPFGTCIKKHSRRVYHISPDRLIQYQKGECRDSPS
jgi:hypothetical protein